LRIPLEFDFYYSISSSARIIKLAMERAVYRIIDANFNRAREAMRVIEEFCRFALNSAPLSERAGELRHKLSAAIGKLDVGGLISSRDTLGDVGVGRTLTSQLQRAELKDCFAAACKRLTEALRALAETTQPLNPSVSHTIENLRYSAYTLEKDIVLFWPIAVWPVALIAYNYEQKKSMMISFLLLPVNLHKFAGMVKP
jgi:hypothetical protein